MEKLSQFNGFQYEDWKGYNLEQLRYQRALNMARREIATQQINTLGKELSNGTILTADHQSLLTKIISSLNYLDYGVMAWNIFSRMRRITGKFNKPSKQK